MTNVVGFCCLPHNYADGVKAEGGMSFAQTNIVIIK